TDAATLAANFRRGALALFLLLSLAGSILGQRSADAAIGVWPWLVGNIDSYQDEIIDQAKRTGLDTIYMHVWKTTGSKTGELHIVDEAGSWNAAHGRLVPQITLGTFVAKAHRAGLQVVGVVQVFGDPAPYPSDLGHQDFMVETVLRYLVHSYHPNGQRVYPLDGIALDYIRWFGGSNSPALVNRFLDAMRAEVGPMPIHAFVIAGAYAIDGASYDNKFRTYAETLSYLSTNYGQNWEQMAARIDCLMPMAYTANGHVYGSNLALMEGYLRQVGLYARTAVTNAAHRCRILPAIRTWDSTGETTTQATVEACCRGALRGGADGFMAFRYFTARGKTSWFTGLANYSEAGPDLPVAAFGLVQSGVQAYLDASASQHAKYPAAQLQASVDLDGDGSFEGGPYGLSSRQVVLPNLEPAIVSILVRDPAGRTAVASVRFAPAPVLTPTTATVSAQAGGEVAMRLLPGPAFGGQSYVVFTAFSGPLPGTPLGGIRVPLNVDPLTTLAYLGINGPMFPRFAGAFDFLGTASPKFVLPPNVVPGPFIGMKLHFAAVGVDRTSGAPLFASNLTVVTIAP
ncbi:MAG: hypothetical protein H6837_20280, partial [Planctomycetes bacterium]|nr:hypothetical protein [Planctomycetota bacterium]